MVAGWLWWVVCVLGHVRPTWQWGAPGLEEGSSCLTREGKDGICRVITDCPELLARLRFERPQPCSYQHKTPIVCCRAKVSMAARIATNHPYRPYNPGGLEAVWGDPEPPSRPGRIHWNARPPPTQGPGRILWRGYVGTGPSPPSVYPTPSTTPRVTPTPMRAASGVRSSKACKQYAQDHAKIHVWRIHNGKQVRPGKYPHMALLGYIPMGEVKLTWNCGGALVSQRFVVSAAHCFTDKSLKAPVRVRLGEHDLTDDEDNAVDYAIKKWELHPDYRVQHWYHDLALIQLDRNVTFTQYIQPACLWTLPEDPATGLIVTGWGSTKREGGQLSNILLEGNGTLQRVDPEICTGHYKIATVKLNQGIGDGILCAVDAAGSVDTCNGDSGGPLQVTTVVDIGTVSVPVTYVVAVVSGGSRWCGTSVPSIYTRLYHYLDWLENKIWPEE